MPQLTRGSRTARLLGTVGGKQHATDADHEEPLPSTRRSARSKPPAPIRLNQEATAPKDAPSKTQPRKIDAKVASTSSKENSPSTIPKQPAPKGNSKKRKGQADTEKDAEITSKRQKSEEKDDEASRPFSSQHASSQPRKGGQHKYPKKRPTFNNIFIVPKKKNPKLTSSLQSAKEAGNKKRVRHLADAKVTEATKPKPAFRRLGGAPDSSQGEPSSSLGSTGFNDLDLSGVKSSSRSSTSKQASQILLSSGPGSHLSNTVPSRVVDLSETPITVDSDSNMSDIEDDIEETGANKLPICKLCGSLVSQDLYDEWTARYPVMNFREQQKFCDEHKRTQAEKDWVSEGYPAIEWDQLHARLKNHEKDITAILRNPKTSFFRSKLEESINAGKARNVLTHVTKDDEAETAHVTVGYYGMKGLQMITAFIMENFTGKLRRVATKDRIIAERDVAGYVQMVLVPEIAMRLIMEDMDVNEEQARVIMRESTNIGIALNDSEERKAA
ncbi:hypothetical protein BT63DRAFT_420604 [Microthyrium microscopicum]|uniref:Restriction of telomere capping protein 4 n=1 Tax=Microthyrium microscopicum TaxID=703497 RepID=A0A6A6UWG5_9PEZI|nr:hypothetical protein BT63DRAFT_420604 [Microthyrium microscopicum]